MPLTSRSPTSCSTLGCDAPSSKVNAVELVFCNYISCKGVNPGGTGGRVPPKFVLGGHQLHCPPPKVE